VILPEPYLMTHVSAGWSQEWSPERGPRVFRLLEPWPCAQELPNTAPQEEAA
jgi:hypothetical protein